MSFNQELQKQRQLRGFNVDEAAEHLHISVRAYQDRENGRVDMSVPERCGLLVGLGMNYDEAVSVVTNPNSYLLTDLSQAFEMDAADPFVRDVKDAFILSIRTHDTREYEVTKDRVRSAENILGWIFHLCKKGWITNQHISLFIELASRHLDLEIHNA